MKEFGFIKFNQLFYFKKRKRGGKSPVVFVHQIKLSYRARCEMDAYPTAATV